MNIDLNSPKFDEKSFLSKEAILMEVNEYSIFRHYVGTFTVNTIMSSPFRKDNSPSFGIFYSKKFGCLLFKDLAQGISGDCFSLVSRIVYPAFTRAEAMAQVAVDFGIGGKFVLPRQGFSKSKKDWVHHQIPEMSYKEIRPIGIKARPFNPTDFKFWGQFGIDREMLKLYNVIPITHFTYGNNVFTADKLAYAYIERKDGFTTYKIYQPYNKNIKFFTDMDASIHAGYVQLPSKGELLLITKSLKDVMAIRAICNIHSISVLSETILIKQKVIDEYHNRFDNIFVLFDNDEAGLKMARDYKKEFTLQNIVVPDNFKNSKDFSDVVKNESPEAAKNMLENLVWLEKYHAREGDLPFN